MQAGGGGRGRILLPRGGRGVDREEEGRAAPGGIDNSEIAQGKRIMSVSLPNAGGERRSSVPGAGAEEALRLRER